jgi:TPP-dependent trihydroxycyclohexane-1,2-dione (THcHDO) dehydratase
MHNVGEEFGTQFRHKVAGTRGLTGAYVHVDCAANAHSLGAQGFDVRSREELRDVLAKTANMTGLVLIAAHTNLEPLPFGSGAWWEVGSLDTQQPESRKPQREAFAQQAVCHRWFV